MPFTEIGPTGCDTASLGVLWSCTRTGEIQVKRSSIAAAVFAVATAAMPAAAGATVTPIQNETPLSNLPAFTGKAWTAKKLASTAVPQNPYMATNGKSNIHGDSWMTDTYTQSGPLGKNLVQTTNSLGVELPGLCASITFDSQGRIVTVCPSALGTPTLRMFNAQTLDLIASYALPGREGPAPTNIFNDFTGGGYFFLDNQNHAVVSTNDRKLRVFGLNAGGDGFDVLNTYDLTGVLDYGERLSSALPDWNGNYWFISKTKGKVGWINRTSGVIKSITLNEEIENSFTIGQDGVYIVSDKAQYKFNTAGNTVHQIWRTVYPNSGIVKPGQVDAGSGTTPTILQGNLVAITDNADPMNVVVYNSTTGAQTCKVPVFSKGGSATENSLIGWGTSTKSSLIVENNYGYVNPYYVGGGSTTKPGVTKIDVTNKGKTCKVAWKNTTLSAPTLVPKVSLGNGLLYLYTKPKTTNKAEAWFWTAVDASTGKQVWSKFAGTGILRFNNNYAAVHIGPDKALYMGLLGGVARLADGS